MPDTPNNILALWNHAMNLTDADGTDAVVLLLDTAATALAYNAGDYEGAKKRFAESYETSLAAGASIAAGQERKN
jgi:hypothetical protein